MTEMAGGATLFDRMVAHAADPPATVAPSWAPRAREPWGEVVLKLPVPRTPSPMPEPRGLEASMRGENSHGGRELVAAIETLAPVREGKPMALPAVVRPPTTEVGLAASTVAPARARAGVLEVPKTEAPRFGEIPTRQAIVAVPAPAPSAAPRQSVSRPANARREALQAVRPIEVSVLTAPEKEVPLEVKPHEPFQALRRPSLPPVKPDLRLPIPPVATLDVRGMAAETREPVIQVTIGRLEVRLPERGRKSRPAERPVASGPTLDQYLAKRRGGGQA